MNLLCREIKRSLLLNTSKELKCYILKKATKMCVIRLYNLLPSFKMLFLREEPLLSPTTLFITWYCEFNSIVANNLSGRAHGRFDDNSRDSRLVTLFFYLKIMLVICHGNCKAWFPTSIFNMSLSVTFSIWSYKSGLFFMNHKYLSTSYLMSFLRHCYL